MEEWTNNIPKAKRCRGENYLNRKGEEKPQRKIGDKCTSSYCKKSTLRHCQDISDDDRMWIFNHFWVELKTWRERSTYVNALVSVAERKQKKADASRRSRSFIYNLRLQTGVKMTVCKTMFCNTIGVSERTVGSWLEPDNPKGKEQKPRTPKTGRTEKMSEMDEDFLKKWLSEIPCVDSHYCRKSDAYKNKKFLEPGTTVVKLHEIYEQDAGKAGLRAAKETLFRKQFISMNFSVFRPRNDQCDTCLAGKMGHLSNEDLQKHKDLKDLARKEKNEDKDRAKDNPLLSLWTMDTQGVLLCPQSKASTMYYKQKLQVHNLTFHNTTTHDGYCYLWDETDGDVKSEAFASLQYSHFKKVLEQNEDLQELIIWSDGCSYQNKNSTLANMYLYLSKEMNTVITQKYLVSGHTMMECDAMHSLIERNLVFDIAHPRDLVVAVETARKNPRPFYVKHLDFADFYKLSTQQLISIRPGKVAGDPTVNNLSAIQYRPDSTVHYKIFGEIHDWRLLPQRIILKNEITWMRMFAVRRSIKKRKYDDLQEMKKVLPKQVHNFYDNIPFSP